MLDRQAIYSRLKAPLKFQVTLDQRSLDESKKRIAQYLDQTLEKFMVDISVEAVGYLRSMYRSVGRRTLAGMWTNSPLKKNGTTLSITVYNKAEFQPWFTRSNAPNKGGRPKRYQMRGGGASLLAILEEGAKPHYITAQNPNKPLQFPIRRGVAQSRSVGSVRTQRGAEVGRFVQKPFRHNDIFSGNSVQHPGVVGSRFVQLAADRLVRNIEETARARFETGAP